MKLGSCLLYTSINKWSVNSLPDEYVLTDRLEKLPLAQINEKTFSHKVVLVLAWFVSVSYTHLERSVRRY